MNELIEFIERDDNWPVEIEKMKRDKKCYSNQYYAIMFRFE